MLPDLVHMTFHCFPADGVEKPPVNVKQTINGKKVTDHHAIIPTREVQKCNFSELPKGELAILQLIATRLFVAVGDPYRYAETVIELDCAGKLFSAKGKTVLSDGWKSLVKKQDSTEKDKTEQKLPTVSAGDSLKVSGTEIKEGKTTPPKHFTEDTLLQSMETAGAEEMPEDAERKGLGTPATRAGIIEKLVRIGFLERQGDKKTKYLIPTHKGTALVTVKSKGGFREAPEQKQFHLLIDIQSKMAEGKSVGYEKWAKKYNRKEAARTVCLLKEKGVDSYEDLIALTNKLTTRFSELSDSIKAAEKRMVEIGALQTHINNYSKTRKTYEAYRKSGYSKKFFEEHRDELMLHKAAKQAFDQLDGKKVPSRQVLHEEFNRLLIEKKQAYAEYRQVKKEMQEYLIAKQTVETILNIDKKKEQEREEKKPRVHPKNCVNLHNGVE